MSNANPFSLRIFVADGDPDGLRLVERSNWVGKALMFPRALLPQVKQRPELSQTGVYLLLGPRDDGEGEMLYVGEGDPIRPRLESHYAQKDFWTRAVCFVATPGQLNKAHVQYLESNLVRLAKAAKRLPLDNGNYPAEPSLSEADRADMQVFLENMLGMLPVLGIDAFERPRSVLINQLMEPDGAVLIGKLSLSASQLTAAPASGVELTCVGGGVKATGLITSQGFVVFSGSNAAIKSGSSLTGSLDSLRRHLLDSGVLSMRDGHRFFTQAYAFSSPSTAASLVLGRSANGRIEWKDKQGRTLKELQAMETES
jgi:hypothetical protein